MGLPLAMGYNPTLGYFVENFFGREQSQRALHSDAIEIGKVV